MIRYVLRYLGHRSYTTTQTQRGTYHNKMDKAWLGWGVIIRNPIYGIALLASTTDLPNQSSNLTLAKGKVASGVKKTEMLQSIPLIDLWLPLLCLSFPPLFQLYHLFRGWGAIVCVHRSLSCPVPSTNKSRPFSSCGH